MHFSRWPDWAISILCLLSFFGMAVATAWQKSATADEPIHLTRGVAISQGADYRLQQEHAPLSHWLMSLFLRGEPLSDVTALEGWSAADRLLVARQIFENPHTDINRVVWLGRMPIIMSGLLLGVLMMRWAWELGGREAQLAAGVLFAFSPNLIANAALATTDFVTAVTYAACLYSQWRFWQRPSWGNWLLAGVCLGLGLASKMTGLLLLPITGLLAYGQLLFVRPHNWRLWRENFKVALLDFVRPSLWWLSFLPLAALTVWAVYRFEMRPLFVPWLQTTVTLPAATYVESIIRVTSHIDEGHRAYFLGEILAEGWWSYFLVAFLIKTSLPALLLMVWAVWQREFGRMLFLWFPAVILFGLATYTRLNIGYRHILPMLPFLLVWAAVAVGKMWGVWRQTVNVPRPLAQIVGLVSILVLLSWHIVNGIRQHPDHLAHFNALVGGSAEGHKYLLDSNLDWGQDWKAAARYVKQSGWTDIHLAPFGFIDPRYYGLDGFRVVQDDGFGSPEFAAANPDVGHYLLSANSLQGVLAEPDLLDWFRHQEPLTTIGYSIFVYEVAEQTRGSWIAHCSSPSPLLEPEAAAQVVGQPVGGQPTVRHVYFDCQQSWVFPNKGEAGWYILPLQTGWWLSEQFPDDFLHVYHHRATVFAPSYDVFYWTGRVDVETAFRPVGFTPVTVGDAVQLSGYTVESNLWRTVWTVETPPQLPLSVLGHLYAGGETPAAVADGLGYDWAQWQNGDTFVQFHRFDMAGEALQTGLYDFTTGERLPLVGSGETEIKLELEE